MDSYLYAWEGIACIAVMMIHCLLPGEAGALMQSLARFAVPLFFAVSGKYLVLQWRKAKASASAPEDDGFSLRAILKKRIDRTLRTLFFVLAVYTVYSFFWYLLLPGGATPKGISDWFYMKYQPAEWLRLFVFNTGTVIYDGSVSFDHLWYLFALLYVFGILYACGKYLLTHASYLAPLMLLILYGAMHMLRRYHFYVAGVYSGSWYFLRNWLFFGLPFVLFGAMLADVRCGRKGLFIALAGFLLTYLEYRRYGSMEVYLGSLLTVTGALTGGSPDTDGATAPHPRSPAAALAFLGQHGARHVYYWHMLVYSVLIRVLAYLPGNLHARPATGWALPVMTYVVTIAVGILIHSFLRNK